MAKLPIANFLENRIKEFDSRLDVRKGTGFEQLFFKPMQFLLQPIVDELKYLTTAQSFSRILNTKDPDGFSEEAVDALAYNFFVMRSQGGSSSGVARVYHSEPVAREWPTNGILITGSNGVIYSNGSPFAVSKAVTSSQIENGSYYYDIPVQSTTKGALTSIASAGLVSVDNDPAVVSVTNPLPIVGGTERESNKQLIQRVRQSIAVRDLVTGKGFQATMFEKYSGLLRELQTVGFGDPEMMRDIVYNTHIGGKVDAYFISNTVSQGYKNFIGLYPDYSRQLKRSTNLTLSGTAASSISDGNFDVSGDSYPVVTQIKLPTPAVYFGTVNLTGDNDLSVNDRIKMTVGSTTKEFSLKSLSAPSKTTRSDIINKINAEFDLMLCIPYNRSIKIADSNSGVQSTITLSNPDSGNSALLGIFGLSNPTTYYGDGPITFIKDVDYTIDAEYGSITRVTSSNYLVGSVTTPKTGASLTIEGGNPQLVDSSADVFSGVAVYDIVTVNPNPGYGEVSIDYRVIAKDSSNAVTLDVIPGDKGRWTPKMNTPRLENGTGTEGDIYLCEANGDCNFGAGSISFVVGEFVIYRSGLWVKFDNPLQDDVTYVIRRTGIKDGETVGVDYWFNPLSIDIGPRVKNIDYTVSPPTEYRGPRLGRAANTIMDTALLRINQISIIDPVSLESTGQVLSQGGGYGEGGWGDGPYGIGGGADYYIIVNSPHERFSAFEDSVIVLHPSLIGLSLRVDYDYAPECVTLHNFVRSESERVLDGDILIKHFIPAYVSGVIYYSVDETNTSIPSNDALTTSVKNFISQQKAGTDLRISDVYQFLARSTDKYDRYGTYVKPFTLEATVHNVDGTTITISSGDILKMPTLFPPPKDTPRPLSARITHWIGDNIILIRE